MFCGCYAYLLYGTVWTVVCGVCGVRNCLLGLCKTLCGVRRVQTCAEFVWIRNCVYVQSYVVRVATDSVGGVCLWHSVQVPTVEHCKYLQHLCCGWIYDNMQRRDPHTMRRVAWTPRIRRVCAHNCKQDPHPTYHTPQHKAHIAQSPTALATHSPIALKALTSLTSHTAHTVHSPHSPQPTQPCSTVPGSTNASNSFTLHTPHTLSSL